MSSAQPATESSDRKESEPSHESAESPDLNLERMPALERDRFVRLTAAVVFMVFFQTYMIAPLIPSLAKGFAVSEQRVGLLVPAYMLPYGLAGLLLGVLADRMGRRGLFYASLLSMPLLSLLTAFVPHINALIGLRAISGACNAGIVVMALILVGDLYPAVGRGRATGWIFGAIAGGGAFGSTMAGLLAPLIGWRGLFVLVAVSVTPLLWPLKKLWGHLAAPPLVRASTLSLLSGYVDLLRNGRALRTYTYIFLNGMFHSGVFTWLGVHLNNRYGLGDTGIGLAILGYGLPGFLLGPAIGHMVDRRGRRRMLPIGFAIAALAALLFVPKFPLFVAVLAAAILSLGFDMTHPLMAGISMSLSNERRGLAMGMNCFAIFGGFGCGSLIFGELAIMGTGPAMLIFAIFQFTLAATSLVAFRNE